MASRAAILDRLKELYSDNANNLVFLYGRSKMAANEFLSQFLKEKSYVYYCATECSGKMQEEYCGKLIEEACDISLPSYDYETMFTRLHSKTPSKMVLVFDHVELMIKRNPDFFKQILRLKKKELYQGPVMILFLSDSLIFAQKDLEKDYGIVKKNCDDILRISELNFLDVVRKFPSFSISQTVEVYGILGGVPEYLNVWSERQNLKQNICRLILSKDGYLYNEAHDYLSQNLRECSVYQTILASIAQGKEKLNDIFLYTGYSRPKISVYMKNLGEFDVVSKVNSFETGGWDNTKKGIYRINNTYLNFYYRFIFPHVSQLEVMKPEEFYDKYIAKELEDYLNQTFIKVCMEYLELSSAVHQLPIEISKMGTWIGKQGNIDIIAQDKERNSIVGKCSWSESSFTYEMYEQLLENMDRAKVKATRIYLFCARAFNQRLVSLSRTDSRIVLVDMNQM